MKRWWLKFERRRVAVTLKSGAVFLGVLVDVSPEFMELAEASVESEGGPVPADGVVLIERANVNYLQVL